MNEPASCLGLAGHREELFNGPNCSGKTCLGFLSAATALALASPAFSQDAGTNPELQQKVAALKQSVAQNQQALRQYTWTEKMETIFKGETKSTKLSQCQYGPDGKVRKTPWTALNLHRRRSGA
jgi:hypothetical protein